MSYPIVEIDILKLFQLVGALVFWGSCLIPLFVGSLWLIDKLGSE